MGQSTKGSRSSRSRKAPAAKVEPHATPGATWAVVLVNESFKVFRLKAKEVTLHEALILQANHNEFYEKDRTKGIATVLPLKQLNQLILTPGYCACDAQQEVEQLLQASLTQHVERIARVVEHVKTVSDVGLLAASLETVATCFGSDEEFQAGLKLQPSATKGKWDLLEVIGIHFQADEQNG